MRLLRGGKSSLTTHNTRQCPVFKLACVNISRFSALSFLFVAAAGRWCGALPTSCTASASAPCSAHGARRSEHFSALYISPSRLPLFSLSSLPSSQPLIHAHKPISLLPSSRYSLTFAPPVGQLPAGNLRSSSIDVPGRCAVDTFANPESV